MAFSPAFDGTLSVNGIDISAFVEKVEPAVTRADQKLPRLGGNQVARLVGPAETELTIDGWSDPTVTNLLFPLSVAAVATKVPIAFSQQPTVGGATRTGTGYVMSYSEIADAKNPANWTAKIIVDGDWA